MRPEVLAREPVARSVRKRQGWVWPAITAVLQAAEQPLTPSVIYARVAEVEDGRVSKSTIKNELRRQLDKPESALLQDDSGRYSLKQQS